MSCLEDANSSVQFGWQSGQGMISTPWVNVVGSYQGEGNISIQVWNRFGVLTTFVNISSSTPAALSHFTFYFLSEKENPLWMSLASTINYVTNQNIYLFLCSFKLQQQMQTFPLRQQHFCQSCFPPAQLVKFTPPALVIHLAEMCTLKFVAQGWVNWQSSCCRHWK